MTVAKESRSLILINNMQHSIRCLGAAHFSGSYLCTRTDNLSTPKLALQTAVEPPLARKPVLSDTPVGIIWPRVT